MSVARARAVAAVAGALLVIACRAAPSPGPALSEAQALRSKHEKEATARALAAYREVLVSTRTSQPAYAARAAQGLGESLRELGLLSESLSAFRDAFALAQASRDEALAVEIRADLGFALALAADSAQALGEAESHCKAARTTARSLGGLRSEAKALVCEAEVIYSRGETFAPAFELQTEAEAIWNKLGDEAGVAQARLSRGWLRSDLRQFEIAQREFDSARTLFESLGDKRGVAIALVADARLLERRGDYQEALKTYERAESLLDVVGDSLWQGSCLTSKGLIYQYLADLPRAVDHRERGLHALEASGLKIFAIDALMSLGLAYLDWGDEDAALARFERALGLASELSNRRWQAWALRNMSLVHYARGRVELAHESLDRSHALLPGLDERRLEALVSYGLGQVFEARNIIDRARAFYEESLAVSRGAGDRAQINRNLRALGTLEAKAGRFAPARRRLADALTEHERLFGPSHPLVAESRVAVAELDYTLGRATAALAAALEAESRSLEHLRFTIRYLPERQALTFASRRPRGLDLAVSASPVGRSQSAAAIYDLVIQSRAVILDELAARTRLGATNSSDVPSINAMRARQRYANLLVRSLEGAVSETDLETARQDKESAERVLAAESAEARAEMRRTPAGYDALRKALPARTALVSYVQYMEAVNQPAAGARTHPPRPSLAAFILHAEMPGVAIAKLGDRAAIEGLIADWREQSTGRTLLNGTSVSDAQRAVDEVGAELRRRVWDPIAPYVRGATRLFIVPDGALSLVPIAALSTGSDRYLLDDGPPMHYLTAERDLVSRAAEGHIRTSEGMLAMGGAAFDEEPPPVSASPPANSATAANAPVSLRGGVTSCGNLQALRFEPLKGTLEEVREVADLMPPPFGAATTLMEREASEPNFKRHAHRYRVLHLATHGFFLDGACLSRAGPATARGVGGLSVTRTVENPLRLSGLALAGSNLRSGARVDEDDGILTAEEVATLDLQGVEWAVLSACDTGVGEIKAGEGVFGLRRAFQVAGARTVIMSLWSVDDQATRAWMRALYEGRFQRQLSTADAVHQASLTVLRDRRARGLSPHPFFWAAFVAAGDWR